ncbi:MAG: hypothetical protein ACHQT8_06160 [Chlamydiales bacterium]
MSALRPLTNARATAPTPMETSSGQEKSNPISDLTPSPQKRRTAALGEKEKGSGFAKLPKDITVLVYQHLDLADLGRMSRTFKASNQVISGTYPGNWKIWKAVAPTLGLADSVWPKADTGFTKTAISQLVARVNDINSFFSFYTPDELIPPPNKIGPVSLFKRVTLPHIFSQLKQEPHDDFFLDCLSHYDDHGMSMREVVSIFFSCGYVGNDELMERSCFFNSSCSEATRKEASQAMLYFASYGTLPRNLSKLFNWFEELPKEELLPIFYKLFERGIKTTSSDLDELFTGAPLDLLERCLKAGSIVEPHHMKLMLQSLPHPKRPPYDEWTVRDQDSNRYLLSETPENIMEAIDLLKTHAKEPHSCDVPAGAFKGMISYKSQALLDKIKGLGFNSNCLD